jgi:hypothetical protein
MCTTTAPRYRGRYPEPYTREESSQSSLRIACADSSCLQRCCRGSNRNLGNPIKPNKRLAEARGRHQAKLERLQKRVDVLYEDRLDGRIDATTYDNKATGVRGRREELAWKIGALDEAVLPPRRESID